MHTLIFGEQTRHIDINLIRKYPGSSILTCLNDLDNLSENTQLLCTKEGISLKDFDLIYSAISNVDKCSLADVPEETRKLLEYHGFLDACYLVILDKLNDDSLKLSEKIRRFEQTDNKELWFSGSKAYYDYEIMYNIVNGKYPSNSFKNVIPVQILLNTRRVCLKTSCGPFFISVLHGLPLAFEHIHNNHLLTWPWIKDTGDVRSFYTAADKETSSEYIRSMAKQKSHYMPPLCNRFDTLCSSHILSNDHNIPSRKRLSEITNYFRKNYIGNMGIIDDTADIISLLSIHLGFIRIP